MKLYDIHTHLPLSDEDIVPILNIIIPPSPDGFALPKRMNLSVGIHPWYIGEVSAQLEVLASVLDSPQIGAVGEAGLDKLAKTPMEEQIAIFKEQVRLADYQALPLIIHCVKAWDELIRVKKEVENEFPWVIHGFRGKPEQASQLLDAGFYLSFGSHFHPASLALAYPESLFLETDEGDVSIRNIYHRAAQALNIPVEKLAKVIKKNVEEVFIFIKK